MNLDIRILHSIKPSESITIKVKNISHTDLVSKVFNWAILHHEYGFSVNGSTNPMTIRIKNKSLAKYSF